MLRESIVKQDIHASKGQEFCNISHDDRRELIFAYAGDSTKGSTVVGYVSSYNSFIDCEHCPFFIDRVI